MAAKDWFGQLLNLRGTARQGGRYAPIRSPHNVAEKPRQCLAESADAAGELNMSIYRTNPDRRVQIPCVKRRLLIFSGPSGVGAADANVEISD